MSDGPTSEPPPAPNPTPILPAPPVLARPVAERERIDALDVLRGVALLGILIMNIQSFSMIMAAYTNPTAYGDLTGANFTVWLLSHLLADQKFMTLFSMLFGAGIVLMAERAEARGARPVSPHYRRSLWLIVFGLFHAYVLWYGDVLYFYGMCGLLVFLFRKLSPRWLILLGLLSIVVPSLLWAGFGLLMPLAGEEMLTQMADQWQPPAEQVQKELDAYRGGWLQQMPTRAVASISVQTILFLLWGCWRAGGLMLIGMAFYRLGVLTARSSLRLYIAFIAVAGLIGIPLVALGVRNNLNADWDPVYAQFFGWQFNYWGSLLVALGWLGAVMLVCRAAPSARWTRPLAAVGRTALSNYVLQTVICTTIFYGHGLGLFGKVERVGQLGIVVAVWAFQLAISPIWLRRYRFGPLEWLWRSLTYRRRQPFRR